MEKSTKKFESYEGQYYMLYKEFCNIGAFKTVYYSRLQFHFMETKKLYEYQKKKDI